MRGKRGDEGLRAFLLAGTRIAGGTAIWLMDLRALGVSEEKKTEDGESSYFPKPTQWIGTNLIFYYFNFVGSSFCTILVSEKYKTSTEWPELNLPRAHPWSDKILNDWLYSTITPMENREQRGTVSKIQLPKCILFCTFFKVYSPTDCQNMGNDKRIAPEPFKSYLNDTDSLKNWKLH